jgi:hypothetical protein
LFLSIFTFSTICHVWLQQVSIVPWILVFVFPASITWKEIVRHHIDQQCNEEKPLKDIHKDIHVKLGLSQLPKVNPC